MLTDHTFQQTTVVVGSAVYAYTPQSLPGSAESDQSSEKVYLYNKSVYLYLLTQAGIFLAFSLPGFFLSTLLVSLDKTPATQT